MGTVFLIPVYMCTVYLLHCVLVTLDTSLFGTLDSQILYLFLIKRNFILKSFNFFFYIYIELLLKKFRNNL